MTRGTCIVMVGTSDGERRHGWEQVYLKLNTGSSAMGIIVFGTRDPALRGTTTLMEVENQFYNSRFVRTLEGPSLQCAARFVLTEGAIVQRGIPMAQIDGQNFDMRVVCLNGKSVATIFRISSNPMTNLHLGGRRGDFNLCRSFIPTRDWLDALDRCEAAVDCFASTIVGVDLVFERGFRRHYVLEVNAFGDFFPGMGRCQEAGQSTPSRSRRVLNGITNGRYCSLGNYRASLRDACSTRQVVIAETADPVGSRGGRPARPHPATQRPRGTAECKPLPTHRGDWNCSAYLPAFRGKLALFAGSGLGQVSRSQGTNRQLFLRRVWPTPVPGHGSRPVGPWRAVPDRLGQVLHFTSNYVAGMQPLHRPGCQLLYGIFSL